MADRQSEELAGVIRRILRTPMRAEDERFIARAILSAGYQRIPEGSVVDAVFSEVIERLALGIGTGHSESFILGCRHSIEIIRHIQQEYRNRAALSQRGEK